MTAEMALKCAKRAGRKEQGAAGPSRAHAVTGHRVGDAGRAAEVMFMAGETVLELLKPLVVSPDRSRGS